MPQWFTVIEEVWPWDAGFRATFIGVRWIGLWEAPGSVDSLVCGRTAAFWLSPLNHWTERRWLWVKNSTYPIIKNVHFHIYVLRGWIKVIKPLKCVFHRAFIMQFIVLIFSHRVLFHVVFMSNLSEWSGLWQCLLMAFWAQRSGSWQPGAAWGQPVCQWIRFPVSWHGGALLNHALSPLHTRQAFPASWVHISCPAESQLDSLHLTGQNTLLF